MTKSQMNKCLRQIQLEKDDRNLYEIFVDTDICSIRCNDIQIYASNNGVRFEDLLMLICSDNSVISIINIDNIKNVRYTNTNHETFKIL